MADKRIVVGYVIAPLAASITATLVLVAQDTQTINFLFKVISALYAVTFVAGAAVCFVIRLLPTRSMIIYIAWGIAAGVFLALPIQLSLDTISHGHLNPRVTSLVWQVIRSALAGGIGLGVFWFIVVRSTDRAVDAQVPTAKYPAS